MALASFTAPLAALTTIFQPPCPTSWLITTTKIPSQDPPFPSAGPATCDPPQWAANLEDPGFQYYSPAICPSGFAVGPKCEIKDARTNEGFPAITAGETAAYCVPSGFACASDTTDFRGGVWGVAGNTNAPPNRLVVTVAPAMQIRWRDVDLTILQTHPLTPGKVLLTLDEPEPTGTVQGPGIAPPEAPAQVTPPAPPGQPPATTLSSTQLERPDSIIILTSTAGPAASSITLPTTPSAPLTSSPVTRPSTTQASTQTTALTSLTAIRSSSILFSSQLAVPPASTSAPVAGGTSTPEVEEYRLWDWRTQVIAMVLSALLVTVGVVAFVCVLLRRRKPNDPWSKFLRSPSGRVLAKYWDLLATTALGLWIQNRATQIAQSRAGTWARQRWGMIWPARSLPDQVTTKKEMDPEQGLPSPGPVAELDASQRLGSPGNPAELDGYSRWSLLKGSRTSASSASSGVVNRVKTWLATTTQPGIRWTRSARQSRADTADRSSRPYSVKSSRPGSVGSGMGIRASGEWDNFSPVSLKVPTAAHITRAHQRNNSLADAMDSNTRARAAEEADTQMNSAMLKVPGIDEESDEARRSCVEVMNRLSAGTFGAGRASQVTEVQSTDFEVAPAVPSTNK